MEEGRNVSAYPLYDKKVIEAMRQLTVEETLMALHDLAMGLHLDRLRDVGLGRQMFGNDQNAIRPAPQGWDSIDLAMRSAGYAMPGFKQKQDVLDLLGDELGETVWDQQQLSIDAVKEIGLIMESEDVDMEEATLIYHLGDEPHEDEEEDDAPPRSMRAAEQMKEMMMKAKKAHPTHPGSFKDIMDGDIPDDMSGFGWGTDGH